MNKIKIFGILLIIIISIGTYDVLSPTFSVFGVNSSKLTGIKNKIKETVFYIPSRIKKANELEKTIDKLNQEKINTTESILTFYNYTKDINEFKLFKKSDEKILSKNKVKYQINYYDLPLLNYWNSKNKPVGYIEKFEGNIYILSGDGQLLLFNENEIGSDAINLKRIKTNIEDFDFFETIEQIGDVSIRDIEIFNNNIFFSVIYKKNNNCFNLQIYNANLNQIDNLKFKNFYNFEECLNPKDYLEFNTGQSGGRIIFDDHNLIFSTGAFRTRVKPQDDKSLYGKIIKINLETLDANIISKGHRNIQGLTKFKNIIISTEHGPFGGDEVNVHKNLTKGDEIPNYGWPISSYGEHYPRVVQYHKSNKSIKKLLEIAPLKKSHKDFGFIEPIKYFAPDSIGISEIEFSNSNFDSKFSNDVFFGALKNLPNQYAKIYHLKFDNNFNEIIYEDEISIKKRIRDIKIPSNDDKMFLMLESTPSLAILKKVKND